MNRFRVIIEIETYSDAPEEWLGDLVADTLELDEQLISIKSTLNPED